MRDGCEKERCERGALLPIWWRPNFALQRALYNPFHAEFKCRRGAKGASVFLLRAESDLCHPPEWSSARGRSWMCAGENYDGSIVQVQLNCLRALPSCCGRKTGANSVGALLGSAASTPSSRTLLTFPQRNRRAPQLQYKGRIEEEIKASN